MLRTRLTTLVFATICLASSASAQEILREGGGERRDRLDEMEMTDFDRSLWDSLSGWHNGGPVTAADTDGKVVLLAFWSSLRPQSYGPLSLVNRLAERGGMDDLVIVGIHNPEDWEGAVQLAEQRRFVFPVAHDAEGRFRGAMLVDQDPDFYVIDRAGRLRYADIQTASVERAVAGLLEESRSEAATLLDRMAAAKTQAEAEARRTRNLRQRVDLNSLPVLPFPTPSEEAYKDADWPRDPELSSDDNRSRRAQGEPEGPPTVALGPDLNWAPAPPAKTQGMVTVLYFLRPDWLTLYDYINEVERIQTAYSRDVNLVGVLVPPDSDRSNNRGGRRGDEPDEARARTLERVEKQFREYVELRKPNHPLINDYAEWGVLRAVQGNSQSTRTSGSGIGRFLVVLSSDGTVRYRTHSWVESRGFQGALDQIIRNDPGVQARRKAEEEYIKSLGE